MTQERRNQSLTPLKAFTLVIVAVVLALASHQLNSRPISTPTTSTELTEPTSSNEPTPSNSVPLDATHLNSITIQLWPTNYRLMAINIRPEGDHFLMQSQTLQDPDSNMTEKISPDRVEIFLKEMNRLGLAEGVQSGSAPTNKITITAMSTERQLYGKKWEKQSPEGQEVYRALQSLQTHEKLLPRT